MEFNTAIDDQTIPAGWFKKKTKKKNKHTLASAGVWHQQQFSNSSGVVLHLASY